MKIDDIKQIIREELEQVLKEQASLSDIKEVMEIIKILAVSPHFPEIIQNYEDDLSLGLMNLLEISKDFHTAQLYYRAAPSMKIEQEDNDFEQNMNIFLQKLEKVVKSGALTKVLSSNLNLPRNTSVFINNNLLNFIKVNNNKTNPGRPNAKKQQQKKPPWADDDGIDSMLK